MDLLHLKIVFTVIMAFAAVQVAVYLSSDKQSKLRGDEDPSTIKLKVEIQCDSQVKSRSVINSHSSSLYKKRL